MSLKIAALEADLNALRNELNENEINLATVRQEISMLKPSSKAHKAKVGERDTLVQAILEMRDEKDSLEAELSVARGSLKNAENTSAEIKANRLAAIERADEILASRPTFKEQAIRSGVCLMRNGELVCRKNGRPVSEKSVMLGNLGIMDGRMDAILRERAEKKALAEEMKSIFMAERAMKLLKEGKSPEEARSQVIAESLAAMKKKIDCAKNEELALRTIKGILEESLDEISGIPQEDRKGFGHKLQFFGAVDKAGAYRQPALAISREHVMDGAYIHLMTETKNGKIPLEIGGARVAVAISDKWLNFRLQREGKDLSSDFGGMPVWLQEKIKILSWIKNNLPQVRPVYEGDVDWITLGIEETFGASDMDPKSLLLQVTDVLEEELVLHARISKPFALSKQSASKPSALNREGVEDYLVIRIDLEDIEPILGLFYANRRGENGEGISIPVYAPVCQSGVSKSGRTMTPEMIAWGVLKGWLDSFGDDRPLEMKQFISLTLEEEKSLRGEPGVEPLGEIRKVFSMR